MKILLALLLTGCATQAPIDLNRINTGPHTFELKFVKEMRAKNGGTYRGLQVYDKRLDLHTIYLPIDDFPGCLAHEILHILYPDFHKGRTSVEWCYNE